MRKSNFLKKTFSSVGTSSPHFQKRLVTYNIAAFLFIIGSVFISGGTFTVFAQENITQEVSASSPDDSDILAELTSINYRLDDLNTTLEEDVEELQNTNKKLDALVGINGYIFGGIFMLIFCIVFIAVCKLLNTFFRF